MDNNAKRNSKQLILLTVCVLILIIVVFLRLPKYNNAVFNLQKKQFFIVYPTMDAITNFLLQPTSYKITTFAISILRMILVFVVGMIQRNLVLKAERFTNTLPNLLVFVIAYELMLLLMSNNYVFSVVDILLLSIAFCAGFALFDKIIRKPKPSDRL